MFTPLFGRWGEKCTQANFIVPPNGKLHELDQLGVHLYGHIKERASWRNPPTFEVSYPKDGEFGLTIDEAAGRAILEMHLDDHLALREKLPQPSYRRQVGQTFRLSVPAGKHRIRVDNAGDDWFTVSHYLLTNYRDAGTYPDLAVWGLQAEESAYLWVHNELHTWACKRLGIAPEAIEGVSVNIEGLKDGDYTVRWWDTYQGTWLAQSRARRRRGALQVTIPRVDRDIAAAITRP
jgi:hypothetical protein